MWSRPRLCSAHGQRRRGGLRRDWSSDLANVMGERDRRYQRRHCLGGPSVWDAACVARYGLNGLGPSASSPSPREVNDMEILNSSMFTEESVDSIFSDDGFLATLLRVEAAIALAQADAGVIPNSAAERIREACEGGFIDASTVFKEGAAVATPIIPLVQAIEGLIDSEAAGFIHYGVTSQDIIDTALMLQSRAATQVIRDEVAAIADQCADFTRQYRHTLMVGRTLGQHALPITFGLKAARWLGGLLRDLERLDRLHSDAFATQFGGATGTLASLETYGLVVGEQLAARLDLILPDQPWHTERDRVGEIVSVLAVLVGTLSKIATDIVMLSQTDVGELSEAPDPGVVGSSALPQKQNPVRSVRARAAARLAVANISSVLSSINHEHERAAGDWQAEWACVPNAFRYTAGCASLVREALGSLVVNENRMRDNLSLTRGAIMAESLSIRLAPSLGRSGASALVAELCARARDQEMSLFEAASSSEEVSLILSDRELRHLVDPQNYLGSTEAIIDRVLNRYIASNAPKGA